MSDVCVCVCVPGVEGLQALVAGLLLQTADGRVAGGGQGHGAQHQGGDGLDGQHVDLSPLQVLLGAGLGLDTHTQPKVVNLTRPDTHFKVSNLTLYVCVRVCVGGCVCVCTSCWVSSSWSIGRGWVTSTPSKVAHVSSNWVLLLQPTTRSQRGHNAVTTRSRQH